MQTIVSQLDLAFRSAITAAFGVEADPLLGASQNEKFADYQSNAAMGLAKVVSEKTGQKTNPRAVAEQIKAKLAELGLLGEMAQEVTIAGPGFINIRLSPAWLARQLGAIAPDPRLGIDKTAHPQRVVVDYSGPNVAKQMHVGHLRSTIIGDAISRVIEFQGHEVIRQNHIGDWGTQFGMLIAYIQWLQQDRLVAMSDFPGQPQGIFIVRAAQGKDNTAEAIQAVHIHDLENFYREAKYFFDKSPEFATASRETVIRLQSGQPEELAFWKRIVDETRRHYEPIYRRLGVKLGVENERGESFYNPMLRKVVDDLKSKGIAKESEGAIAVFVDGFENPLLIEKTGGGFLYGTTDLAAIRYRVEKLHANRIIYTHDSRQAQHFSQVFTAARRAGWANDASLEYAPFGTMLGEDGKPFKTRSGDTVKLKDLLDEAERRALEVVLEKNPEFPESQRGRIAHSVGIGAVKYADLSKDRNSDYIFSWDKMLTFDGNTAPYMQYAHARIASIFRKAAGTAAIAPNLVPQLESPFEQALAKHILRFQEVVALVSRELKPHYLCAYLYELAGKFSSFYEHCEVLKSEEPTRSSRLLLIDIARRTLATGLELLGIEHPDQM